MRGFTFDLCITDGVVTGFECSTYEERLPSDLSSAVRCLDAFTRGPLAHRPAVTCPVANNVDYEPADGSSLRHRIGLRTRAIRISFGEMTVRSAPPEGLTGGENETAGGRQWIV